MSSKFISDLILLHNIVNKNTSSTVQSLSTKQHQYLKEVIFNLEVQNTFQIYN